MVFYLSYMPEQFITDPDVPVIGCSSWPNIYKKTISFTSEIIS